MIYRIFKHWRNRHADFTHVWFMSVEGLLLACLLVLVSPLLLKIGLSISTGQVYYWDCGSGLIS